jgi:hypothetical protein
MSGTSYVYGSSNGESYQSVLPDAPRSTHWDPRISVQSIAGCVQVGVVPASPTASTEDVGVWVNEDGEFLTLSRDGLNRLIEALQNAGAETFGRDRW